jgi:iron complex outermembrane receptor protein
MKKRFLLILSVLFTVSASYSQKNLRDTIIDLKEFVVTGSKIETSRKLVPLTVTQITKQDIETSGQINILPTLNLVAPGIFVTERNILGFGVSTGGSGGITMRGIGASPNTEVLVLIDGHPQYQGLFGHPLPDAYVASDVEKVEIIRGPASILYGSNAMGGTINIITKKQQEDGLTSTWGTSFGSYNTQKYYGTLGYKKDKLSVYASVNHDQTDGIRKGTDFNISNGYAKLGYELSKNINLIADVSVAKAIANDSGKITAPSFFNMDILRGKTALSLENKYEKFEGALKIYHNFGEHTLSDGFHSTDRNSGIMLYQTLKLLPNNTITLGTDLKQYGGMATSPSPVINNQNQLITINELAVYAYLQQSIFKQLTLSAGVRYENNSIYGDEWIPMGGVSYNPTSTTTIKGSVSKGFRSPTIRELYLLFPNPNLKPERMINIEVSWLQSFFNDHLNTELTLFYAKGDSLIQRSPPNVWENTGSFINTGVEFSAKYTVNKHLYFIGNYSYLDLAKPVLAAPRQQLNISGNYTYKIFNLNVATQYIEKLYTSITPKVTQDYVLLNARLSARPVKNLDIFVMGNNLLNQQYEINDGYPMPGINYNIGFNVKF